MILVVDDEPWFISPLRYSLESAGFDIASILSAQECMSYIAAQDPPEAIILDIMLPPGDFGAAESDGGRKTGLLLLKAIRRLLPSVPVVLLSVADAAHYIEEDDASTVFLSKTQVTPEEIVAAVTRLTAGEEIQNG